MSRPRALIVGAGALGLGFLAERMAPDYDLCLADVPGRLELLGGIARAGGFAVNVCGTEGLEQRRVQGCFSAVSVGEPGVLASALEQADLVLTAVGTRSLPRAVEAMAPALNARGRRAWLLFCENGIGIAEHYGAGFADSVVRVDTVMSRMCRFAEAGEAAGAPLLPGAGERLMVESYGLIPLDRGLCAAGPFSPAFQLVETEEFRLWEDIKLFLHNGLHIFIACHAFLEGARRFPEASAALRAEARRVMLDEIVPAILSHHPSAERSGIERYGLDLLERILSPFFADSIERGVRGLEEKLAPGERLLGGRDYVREAGIEPRGFSAAIEAARRISGRGESQRC